MERTLNAELKTKIGKQVLVKGWLHIARKLGKINFLILRDMSGLVQIVVQNPETVNQVKSLEIGTTLSVVATVQQSLQAKEGVELINPEFTVLSAVTEAMPIEINKDEVMAHLETILDYRPISIRNPKIAAVFKIQSEISQVYHRYMSETVHATEYFGPNMIGASSEGGSEFFKVKYFDKEATLAQSSQLYKQMLVGVYERVFAIMPFFRAENSNTVRHLTEGKQLEFEMGFFDSWTEVMDVEEGFIKTLVKHLNDNCETELKLLGSKLIAAPYNVAFPRITFKEAQEIYFKRTGIDERMEKDLSPAAEKELCAYAKAEFGTDLIFITDWARSKRPFYSFVSEENNELTNTFDLLCAGTEITSGGQRKHTYESMVEGIKEKGMDPAQFTDYLSIFKYGMPPHGGFGLGLERLTMTILHLENIREASLFPSDTKRIAGVRIAAKIYAGTDFHDEIIRRLATAGVKFTEQEHEPTPTSEDSAKMRGTIMSEGIKALILRGKKSGKNIMVCVPADQKVDMKTVEQIEGEKYEFENPEVIKQKFGLIIGSIAPFGHLLGMPTYFSKEISKEARAAFNCGYTTKSVIMDSADLIKVVNPTLF